MITFIHLCNDDYGYLTGEPKAYINIATDYEEIS